MSYILLAVTYFISHRYKLLMTTITSNVLMGVGLFLLGGFVGVWMCVIAICRDIVSAVLNAYRKPEDKMKNLPVDWWLLGLWLSLFTVATAMTQEGFMTLFAYFATMTFTISIWQKNPLVYRVLGIFVGIFWIIYNVVIDSFFGVTLESVLLLFVIGGLIVYCRKNKKTTLCH